MGIENEMLSRFNREEKIIASESNISAELDFFFNNVMDTVVDYFSERQDLKV